MHVIVTATVFIFSISYNAVVPQGHLLTLQLKVCPENERGSGTAAGPMRGGTTPQQERSSATTPASGTEAWSSAMPGVQVPVDPHLQERDRKLLCLNRQVTVLSQCIYMYDMHYRQFFLPLFV